MKLYQIYFSPTGGTKKVMDIVASAWSCEKADIDLSAAEDDFTSYSFHEEDICLVAVPSFGGRVPAATVSRLAQMKGGRAKTILLCVYGNRAYEDTLSELSDTLQKAGFQCVAAVAAIAEHSIMHQFAAQRPDEQDKEELLQFAAAIKDKIESSSDTKEIQLPGNAPYREYNGVPFKPHADKHCNACGLCVSRCPVQAIKAEKPVSVDETACISCMRCVSICPQRAMGVNKILLMAASQKMKKAFQERKNNELFT